MDSKILIGYATRYGSTREVAEAVAAALGGKGFEVDLQPLKNVRSLEGYSAVVMGAPLYMFHWLKDAHTFLKKHQPALAKLPAAVFAPGPIDNDEDGWKKAQSDLDQELAKYPWFKPVSVKVMGGKFDPAALTFPFNLLPAMKQLPPGDLRDWEDIRHWAVEVGEKIQSPEKIKEAQKGI